MTLKIGMGTYSGTDAPADLVSPKAVEHFTDFRKANEKRPKETDYIGKKGYKRTYRPDGTYEWRYRYKTNEGGKPTREFQESVEMLKPFAEASANLQARHRTTPKEKLRDANGATHYVEPALADVTARRNGWSHGARAVRATDVESGPGGMLFRRVRAGWEPVGEGRWHLWEPASHTQPPVYGKRDGSMRRLLPQMDPDLNPWEWRRGQWVRL